MTTALTQELCRLLWHNAKHKEGKVSRILKNYNGNKRNGADSFDTLEYLAALARTENDLPALVFYSLIGKNILCPFSFSVFPFEILKTHIFFLYKVVLFRK